MTRHNLDEHLRWLLTTKPSIPPPASSLPLAPISLTPIELSQGPSSETDAEASLQHARETAGVGVQNCEVMARLRTMPGSARKPNLVSTAAAGSSSSLPASRDSLPTAARPSPKKWTSVQPRRHVSPVSSEVEIMDLTEIGGKMGSATPNRTRSTVSSRKRKSSEFESDMYSGGCSEHRSKTNPRKARSPQMSQQSFTAIDEIMEGPSEPPPPYSTIPPGIILSASRLQPAVALNQNVGFARSAGNLPVTPDPEDDNDDDIVNFMEAFSKRNICTDTSPSVKRVLTRSPPLMTIRKSPPLRRSAEESIHSSKVLELHDVSQPHLEDAKDPSPSVHLESMAYPIPSGAQDVPDEDAVLLKRFFTLSTAESQGLLERLEALREALFDEIAQRMDQERDVDDLQQQLDELDGRCEAVSSLLSKYTKYQTLCHEKDQLYAAMKHAVRSRQSRDAQSAAQAANSAGRNKLQRFESECLVYLKACKRDVAHVVNTLQRDEDPANMVPVAVFSTQAPRHDGAEDEPVIPSSSRIMQTQMVKRDFGQSPEQHQAPPKPRSLEISPSKLESFVSSPKTKSRSGTSSREQPEHAFHQQEDMFDDIDYDTIFASNEQLFSNRMGTPPAPCRDLDDDEFGVNDDEMLEFVEDVENFRLPAQPPPRTGNRPVFGETCGNSQKIGHISAKKTKRATLSNNKGDADLEELFRFSWSQDVKVALRDRFRLRGFRENQLQAINATLSGKDAFVLMPTGGGKSLCYQLPSLLKSGKTRGVTVVISPLLSLMEDQVQHLRNLQIQAFFINSETTREERSALMEALGEAQVAQFVQLLYVTPEMLSKSQAMIDAFGRLYRRQMLARLVIDEAHCVSQWGHDFRPDYKLLGDVRRKFPNVPVMALTATATENVKVDVIHNLGIDGCEVFTQSFNRPNLYYEVRAKGKGKEDIANIAKLIKEKYAKQTGIIYCFSRKNCEEMGTALSTQYGIKAHHYHAGMDPKLKSKVQKQWQAGEYHVIVATIAFGMGIDKGDVRYVIHHSIPKSLEGYYQETGRAGRDSKKSGCYLFYGYQDAGKLRRMIDEGDGSWEQKDRQHQMLRKMVQYCENKSDCRRVQVLGYFNENFERDECEGQCDNCTSPSTFEMIDFTKYAEKAVSLVRQIELKKVTVLYCIDVFRGAKAKKVMDNGHNELREFAAGKQLDRGDIERLFYRLLNEDVLREKNVVNRSGFANQYVILGDNCDDFRRGKKQLKMEIRTTPRAKEREPTKRTAKKDVSAEQSKNWKKTAGSMAPPELPMSTNVSSPIQAAASRKNTRQQVRRKTLKNGYEGDIVVVSDPEDESYAETGDQSSDDAFEPIRVAGQPRKEKTRNLGPPIVSDNIMDGLHEIHRVLVDDFVERARLLAKDIMLKKSLRSVPFSDTMLRAMAINFTETEEKMLQIPGIVPKKVELYGKAFCKMVEETRQRYDEIMAQNDDVANDPNAKNVIDLVSDDEEDQYDYGSCLDDSDSENEDGEPSNYFQPSRKVEAFNARFAGSQSAAMRSMASSENLTAQKATAKGSKKRKYRPKGSNGFTGRRKDTGAPRHASSSYSGPSAGVTKRAPARRSGSKSVRSAYSSAVGGGGISMMPT